MYSLSSGESYACVHRIIGWPDWHGGGGIYICIYIYIYVQIDLFFCIYIYV
jgi:hypothetical protein